jgi:hypothetical protein
MAVQLAFRSPKQPKIARTGNPFLPVPKNWILVEQGERARDRGLLAQYREFWLV